MNDMITEIKASARFNSSELKKLGISIFSNIISRVISSIILNLISHFVNF